MQIQVAVVQHSHGEDIFVGCDEEAVDKQLADYCRHWWSEVVGEDQPQPEKQKDLIDTYFKVAMNIGAEELLERRTLELDLDENGVGDMPIRKWLKVGEFDSADIKDTKDLMALAGRRLDKAYAHDIVGDCVFEGADGNVYLGQVEFLLMKLSPEDAEAARKEAEEEA